MVGILVEFKAVRWRIEQVNLQEARPGARIERSHRGGQGGRATVGALSLQALLHAALPAIVAEVSHLQVGCGSRRYLRIESNT